MKPATEMTKHFIPSHFFEDGDYEVWATRYNGHGAPVVLIASGLSLKTARAFNWPNKEIRRMKPITPPKPKPSD